MKKLSLTFLTFTLLVSCIKAPKEEAKTSSGNASASAPFLWMTYPTPKALMVSQNFNGVSEPDDIEEMALAWTSAVENKKVFFSIGGTTPEITNGLSSLDDLLDNTFGIYKTVNWPAVLPNSALAVTQLFGRRYNVGAPNEYVDIEHADILMNFKVQNDGYNYFEQGYDFRTVILHELGHFLGLQHKSASSDRTASVMYPSISTYEFKDMPLPIDAADLAHKYNLILSSSLVGQALMHGTAGGGFYATMDSGEPVRILMELHRDGECVHKINGAPVERHQVNLKGSF